MWYCNRWLTNNRPLFLSFEGWELHDQDRAGGWWTVVFSLCPQRAQGVRHLSGVSFIKALITPRRVPPSWPNHLPKALSPNTIPLVTSACTEERVRAKTRELLTRTACTSKALGLTSKPSEETASRLRSACSPRPWGLCVLCCVAFIELCFPQDLFFHSI